MIIIKRVTEFSELEGIRKLQEDNLTRNLPGDEPETEGFVTAEYSIEFLEKLHRVGPSIIAKDAGQVVGYALVATRSVGHQHELLSDLFNYVDKIIYQGLLLKNVCYVIVGQLCVAKTTGGGDLFNRCTSILKNH
ncbi:MAG: hypothetical protein WDM78_20480 [Puia sp.]